jgi:hypothetical protein
MTMVQLAVYMHPFILDARLTPALHQPARRRRINQALLIVVDETSPLEPGGSLTVQVSTLGKTASYQAFKKRSVRWQSLSS